MSNNSCNGWTNEETWALGLWLMNDEGLHYAAYRLRHDEKALKEFCQNLPEEILKEVGDMDEVNWVEIIEALEE